VTVIPCRRVASKARSVRQGVFQGCDSHPIGRGAIKVARFSQGVFQKVSQSIDARGDECWSGCVPKGVLLIPCTRQQVLASVWSKGCDNYPMPQGCIRGDKCAFAHVASDESREEIQRRAERVSNQPIKEGLRRVRLSLRLCVL
jgi:hypothetical protein